MPLFNIGVPIVAPCTFESDVRVHVVCVGVGRGGEESGVQQQGSAGQVPAF